MSRKVVLEYDLPDDEAELDIALRGREAFAALSDIASHIRSKLKYDNAMSNDARAALETVRELIPYVLLDETGW